MFSIKYIARCYARLQQVQPFLGPSTICYIYGAVYPSHLHVREHKDDYGYKKVLVVTHIVIVAGKQNYFSQFFLKYILYVNHVHT